ncbi:MAG: DUF2499 domain-containing protein [Cyanothece sp. SIO1E1]|nr:DUF2499 domain-containing protein [Cyanothece sp. SIO1E1]
MHTLSIPTWIIHISSVIEWLAAILLVWTYAEVSLNLAWRTLSFGMLPVLIGAMCACTWHFFDNAESLQWLVDLQATMTVVGNCTLCLAAWWIWRSARTPQTSQSIVDDQPSQPGKRP